MILGKESWERGKESRVVVIGLADQLAKDCWIKKPAEENPARTVANQKTLERFLVSAMWAKPCTEEVWRNSLTASIRELLVEQFSVVCNPE